MGIRPQDIDLAAPGNANGRFQAKVDVIETLGSEKLLHLVLGEQQFTARVEPHAPVEMGDEVMVQAEPNMVQLFDATTGAALR
jgi:multiple sugar transport system ATP-binding protein